MGYPLGCEQTETTVADPGFPRGGANPTESANLLFGQSIFPKNCMKMKTFWARQAACVPRAPPPPSPDPPMPYEGTICLLVGFHALMI